MKQQFTPSSEPPIAFSSNLMKRSKDTLNYGFIWDTILLFVHINTNGHMKTNNLYLVAVRRANAQTDGY